MPAARNVPSSSFSSVPLLLPPPFRLYTTQITCTTGFLRRSTVWPGVSTTNSFTILFLTSLGICREAPQHPPQRRVGSALPSRNSHLSRYRDLSSFQLPHIVLLLPKVDQDEIRKGCSERAIILQSEGPARPPNTNKSPQNESGTQPSRPPRIAIQRQCC